MTKAVFLALSALPTRRTMKFNDFSDDSEDSEHTPAQRSAAASRSTWVSVGVNLDRKSVV